MIGRCLGFTHVVAIDNDPDAVMVARENAALNGMNDIVIEETLSGTDRYDVVVANILQNTLLELHTVLCETLAQNGTLIVSGITHDQEATIVKAFGHLNPAPDIRRMGEWSAIVFWPTAMR